MIIRLPADPKAEAYEDFVTAYAFASGYFVETRLKLRDGTVDVLELDVVATSSSARDGKRLLIEAKSGGWGFPDVFKVYGWISYLGIQSGVLIYREEIEHRRKDALTAVSKKTNVSCHRFDIAGKIIESPFGEARKIDADLGGQILTKACYSQISQRIALSVFTSFCKSHTDAVFQPLIVNAVEYQRAADRSFFEGDPAGRVASLYQAYQLNPNLSGAFVAAVALSKDIEETGIWNAANDTNEYFWLQYVMSIEHRARICIIKTAVDLIANGRVDKVRLGAVYGVTLPASFLSGLEKLAAFPEWEKVPFLFQTLVDIFGGYYFEDELELLSRASGMSAENIPTALALYSDFFPTSKGWFFTFKGLIRLKLIPAFLRGIGCFFRQSIHGLDRYEAKYPNHHWLLAKWHNVAIAICGRELAAPVSVAQPALPRVTRSHE